MAMVKRFLVYAIALIAGNFCGKWASKIVGDSMGFFDSIGGASYVSSKVMIPTNIIAAVEFLVIVLVLLATVQIVDRLGILK